MGFPPQGNKSGGDSPLTAEQIRDALLSLPEGERKFIITNPNGGEYKVLTIRKNGEGALDYDFEDVPE